MEACRVFPGEFGCGEALCGPGRVTTEKWASQISTRQFFQHGTENSQRDPGCPWELYAIWIRVNYAMQQQREQKDSLKKENQ